MRLFFFSNFKIKLFPEIFENYNYSTEGNGALISPLRFSQIIRTNFGVLMLSRVYLNISPSCDLFLFDYTILPMVNQNFLGHKLNGFLRRSLFLILDPPYWLLITNRNWGLNFTTESTSRKAPK